MHRPLKLLRKLPYTFPWLLRVGYMFCVMMFPPMFYINAQGQGTTVRTESWGSGLPSPLRRKKTGAFCFTRDIGARPMYVKSHF